jgi:murein DD-endopeptidase MepM/ murein hydrolase activator NlpD
MADPNQNVVAVMGGTVTRIGYPYADDLSYRYVEIHAPNGYTVRELYVSPGEEIVVGSQVTAGQIIGSVQDLTTRYIGITNHVHVEIRFNGDYINPATLILHQ